MNSDNLTQLLQRSLRVTLGATASLVEVLQNPQKRQENLSKLSAELSQLTEEWAAKGEVTEQEARTFVDSMIAQATRSTEPSDAYPASMKRSTTVTTTATPAPDPGIESDLRELTAQIAAMRAELDRLKESPSD